MSGTAFTRGHHLCFMVLALLLMALIPEPVAAQRGGSDRGRGGSGGGFQGRGGSGGGFQGRGGSDRGAQGRGGSDRGSQGRGGSDRGSQGRGGSDRGSQGRGGSDRGSQGRGGSGGTSEFLKRLDTNGNGNLDPSEQGRMRPLLERISSARRDRGSSSLDLSRPIPISRLTEEFNRMREERNGGSSSRGSSRGGGLSRGDSGSLSQTELEPLVPTFDFEEEQYIPLPTFGPEGERNTVNVTEADRKEAAQTMKRYDKNGDNVLSKEEIAQARWRDDPLQQDRNRDGRLTMNELYLRYALRRTDNKDQSSSSNRGGSSRGSSSRSSSSRDSSSRGSSSGRDSSGRGSSGRGGDSSSSSGTDRMAFFANSMMQRYDKNGSGVLEKDEWKSFRTDPSPGDTNKDGKLTKEELTKWMSSRFGQRGGDRSSGAGSRGRGGDSSGGRGRGGDSSGGRGRGDSGGRDRGGKSDSDKPTSYRFKTLAERLPEGLPEWFKSNDANGDGQIMMAEYSKNWNAQMLDSFDKFDFNADGVITAQECLDAIDEGARFGGSASDSRSRSASQKDDSGSKEGSKESSSKSSSGGSSRAARYANSIMEKMDSDKSGSLSKEEWSKSRWIKDSFDKDGDGKMTVEELTKGFGG